MVLEMLQTVTSEAWVGLAGVLFGSLLTTLSVWLTNRANFKQLQQQLVHEEKLASGRVKKERLEELYILICHWNNIFFGNHLQLTLVMRGKLSYNEYLDNIISSGSQSVDFNRISMIIDIYGGEFKEAYLKVLGIRDEINDIESLHKKSYLKGQPGNLFLKPAGDAQLKLAKACDELKVLVSDAARAA